MKYFTLFLLIAATLFSADIQNPTSKAYMVSVEGQTSVIVDDSKILEPNNKDVFNATGLVFRTEDNSNTAAVLSNGSGLYVDSNTNLKIKKFTQEPFSPNRMDPEVEPSLSQTDGFISHGRVAICTARIVAGSSMIYNTPEVGVRLRDNKVVISTNNGVTEIIAVTGQVSLDFNNNNGQFLRAREKGTIKDGKLIISKLNGREMQEAEKLTTMACQARQSVYFDIITEISGAENNSEIVVFEMVLVLIDNIGTVSPSTIN
jgi:hypothetical protein